MEGVPKAALAEKCWAVGVRLSTNDDFKPLQQ
jgi:hypothetical protein